LGPALGGALIGAIVVASLGFGVGGWMTGASVDKLVRTETQATLVSVMLPICLNQAEGDPERAPKMERLHSASAWSRDDVVSANGWATMPGAEEPARGVAQACAESLIKAASTN
jgi:hypothetical protein